MGHRPAGMGPHPNIPAPVNPETFTILCSFGALVIGAILGALVTGLCASGKVREAERDAIRMMQKLHRTRAIVDRRDATSARVPHA